MIEMRWLKQKIEHYRDGLPDGSHRYETVLQYRQRVFIGGYAGMQEPQPNAWSEWIDVPTVKEG
jgi:hypothetical protein